MAPQQHISVMSLARTKTRSTLSGPGFRAFLAIAERWRLSVHDQLTLLGSIPPSTYHLWKSKGPSTLSRDQLERISLLIGIWRGLRLLFAEERLAEQWLTAINEDFPFFGASPLSTLLRGSIDDLYAVRRYIDGWRDGDA